MLNLITVGFNHTYLKELHKSILKKDDIVWYVITNNENTNYPDFLSRTPNIHWLNCSEPTDFSNFNNRINRLFELVYEEDPQGHFQIIDEDTLYLPNSYEIYRRYKDYRGLIIGNQLYYNDTLRLKSCIPREAFIDSGNCLCSTEVLKYIRWGSMDNPSPDFKFWDKCYKYFNNKAIILDESISYYNAQKFQLEG